MKNITLEFTPEQLSLINAALGEVPYKMAAPLIQNINEQIQRLFDASRGDDPTGQTVPKDAFAGD